MLHGQAHLIVQDGKVLNDAMTLVSERLKDGDYTVLIMDDNRNRSLPQLKYLFGVVLKTISDQLPEHPSVDALYRYFEEVYAPLHTCNLPRGEKFDYFDLKNEKASEVSKFIESIVHHATTEWGIQILPRDEINKPEAKELWAGAYTNQWNLLSRN